MAADADASGDNPGRVRFHTPARGDAGLHAMAGAVGVAAAGDFFENMGGDVPFGQGVVQAALSLSSASSIAVIVEPLREAVDIVLVVDMPKRLRRLVRVLHQRGS